MLKELLQGKWLGHPLHPALVHVPVGLFPTALLCDILSRSGIGGNVLVQTGFCSILVGLIVSLLAAPAGLADWLDIKSGRPAYKIGLWHMALNLVVVVLFAINLALRWNRFRSQAKVEVTPFILSALGTAILLVSAYLGSLMVFDQGIGIARMSKGKWRKLAVAGQSNTPDES
jgi:uncharacterized membrane protein